MEWSLLTLAIALLLAFCGCSGDGGSDNEEATGNPPSSQPTNRIAGHTFQFTVTQSHNFSEPAGAVYSIQLRQDGTYTFFPSPQNHETTMQENGHYTYNPETGAIHFARPDHQDLDGTVTFQTRTSGMLHLTGPEGETEDANFVQTS